jgi:hypothetical protein
MKINFIITLSQGIYSKSYEITARNFRDATGQALQEFMLDEHILAQQERIIKIKTEVAQ